ncbi:sigma-54 dependent transcriptional regulator [Opitutales bacterium]|nr:sigma-54 dependent transcriptional regulator [Opitutales bacterium]MDC0646729.1 sigma-54 dependent transcriptional regulator [Opitutales bacterium]
MKINLLIVDDEPHTREGLELALEDEFEVFTATSAKEAVNALDEEEFQVILTDLRMPGDSGMSVIDHAIRHSSNPLCIMMTAYGEVEVAVEAMKRGAFDFLPKPINLEQLELLIKRGLTKRKLDNKNSHHRVEKKYKFDGIMGKSMALENVLEKVRLVGPSKATVLLSGETGTGKELFAQAIHQNSERAKGPFVPVHCAALPANLLESEIFGHEKGAFTGASERRIGRFESANGGTLFLDEIGEIDASTQVKLLRFLETKTIERLGSSSPLSLDVRLVCATNRNLLKMSQNGEFRDDLYYRLNVVTIELPPLRDRGDDLVLMMNHFIKVYSDENDFETPRLSDDVLSILQNYNWPGNVRELRNFCENLVVLKRGKTVSPNDLDPRFTLLIAEGEIANRDENSLLSVEGNEKRLLRDALLKSKGNRTKAAQLMGISRRTLHRKLDRWPELDTK